MCNNVDPGANPAKVPVDEPDVTAGEESAEKSKPQDPYDGVLDNDRVDNDFESPLGLG